MALLIQLILYGYVTAALVCLLLYLRVRKRMRGALSWKIILLVIKLAASSAIAISSFFAAISSVDPNDWNDLPVQLIDVAVRLKTISWLSLPLVGIGAVFGGLHYLLKSGRLWDAVHAILDQIQLLVFSDRDPEGESPKHRVTLFRKVEWSSAGL